MKKYKLLKDLPLYPAGTICEIREQGIEEVLKVAGDSLVEIMSPEELQTIREDGRFDEWFEEIGESKVWKPKEGEEYWYIDEYGDTGYDGYNDWYEYSALNKCRLVIGNCFRTEKEAANAIEKLKALRRLRETGLKFDGYE